MNARLDKSIFLPKKNKIPTNSITPFCTVDQSIPHRLNEYRSIIYYSTLLRFFLRKYSCLAITWCSSNESRAVVHLFFFFHWITKSMKYSNKTCMIWSYMIILSTEPVCPRITFPEKSPSHFSVFFLSQATHFALGLS